jgi:sulfur carrier protein
MKVWLNDEPLDLPDSINLQQTLEHLSYANTTFAVAINLKFIPQSDYAHTLIQAGDRLDIVTPMQGG